VKRNCKEVGGQRVGAGNFCQGKMNCGHAASSTNSCKISMVAMATTLPIPLFSFQNLYDVLLSGRVRVKEHSNEGHENGKRNSEDDAND